MRFWTTARRAAPYLAVMAAVSGGLISATLSDTSLVDGSTAVEPAQVRQTGVPLLTASQIASTRVLVEPYAQLPTADGSNDARNTDTDTDTDTEASAGKPEAMKVVAELPRTDVAKFSMLGVTWESGVRPGARVQGQWRSSDGSWSPWTDLHIEPGDPLGGRQGTDGQWVERADAAAVRVLDPSGASRPADLRMVTVDPGATPAITPAAATVGQPAIVLRSSWGAARSDGCAPVYGDTTRGAVVHHTVGSNNYSRSQSAGIVKSTQAYHMQGKGWCDIGYNFLVDRFGQIFEGRAGGITKPVRGAHAGNWDVNSETMGVSMMGTFTDTDPTQALKNSVADLIAWRFAQYGIPATGTYTLGGVRLDRIAGHRNVVGTECPGIRGYAFVNASGSGGLRGMVAQRLANANTSADVPSGVKVIGTSKTSVDVTWKGVKGAAKYAVMLSSSPSMSPRTFVSSTSTRASFSGLKPGTVYYARVNVRDASTNEDKSAYSPTAEAPTFAFDAPTGVKTLQREGSTLKFGWNAVKGAKGYDLLISRDPKVVGSVFSYPTNTTSVTITASTPGVTYYVKVRARDVASSSPLSEGSSTLTVGPDTVLGPPKGLTKLKRFGSTLTLGWDAKAGSKGYEVIVSRNSSVTGTTYSYPSTTNSVTIPTASAGVTYYAKVRLFDPATNKPASELSDAFSVTPEEILPAPTGLKVLKRVGSELQIGWDDVDDARAYSLQISRNASVTGRTFWNRTDRNSLTIDPATPGVTYYARVLVRDPESNKAFSPLSTILKIGPNEVTPVYSAPAPSNITVLERSGRTLKVGWNPVSGAKAYDLLISRSADMSGEKYLFDTNTNAVTIPTTTAGVTYYAQVRVRDPRSNAAISPLSPIATLAPREVTAPQQFAAPTDVKVIERQGTSLTMGWAAQSGAEAYTLEISRNPAMTSGVYKFPTDRNSVTIDPAAVGVTYYVRVRVSDPIDAQALSPASRIVTVGPKEVVKDPRSTYATPTGLKVVKREGRTLTLGWNAIPGAQAYTVAVSRSASMSSGVHWFRSTTNSVTIDTTTRGVVYYAYVRARDPQTNVLLSPNSVTTQIPAKEVAESSTTPTPTPTSGQVSAPAKVKVTKRSGRSITVGWDAVSGARAYTLAISRSADMSGGLHWFRTSTNSVTIDSSTPGVTYYAYVRARDPETNTVISPNSSTLKIGPNLYAPTGVKVLSRSGSAIKVGWTAVPGAQRYDLQVSRNKDMSAPTYWFDSTTNAVTVDPSSAKVTYYVRVRVADAKSRAGLTPLSAVVTVAPPSSNTANSLTVPSGRTITVKGHGFGHGKGMSQHGAQGAALAGKSGGDIVRHYYPGTSLTSVSRTMRVLISGDTTPAVGVKMRKGLVFRGPNGKTRTLPSTAPQGTIAAWSIVPRGTSNVLQYQVGSTWRDSGATAAWSGVGQFETTSGTLGLILPSGSVAEYRGALQSKQPSSGSSDRDTVNVLGLESYLQGVVPAEMPPSWKREALRAQAIAARTFAVRSMNSSRYYDVCDTTACQVYRGASGEYSSTNEAISSTKGLILTYGGSPALTQFSSSSGGWTADGGLPYLKAVSDPWDNFSGNSVHAWSISVAASTIERAYPAVGTLRSLQITKRNGLGDMGGRVDTLKLTGSKGTVNITGDQARWALGLRSNWFGF